MSVLRKRQVLPERCNCCGSEPGPLTTFVYVPTRASGCNLWCDQCLALNRTNRHNIGMIQRIRRQQLREARA